MKYITLYTHSITGFSGTVWRERLPAGSCLTVDGRRYYCWWYLEKNEDGVYCRPKFDRNREWLRFRKWAGKYPDNWIDRTGNLRNRDGVIVFRAPPKETRRAS